MIPTPTCPWCEKPAPDGEIRLDAEGTPHRFHPLCWDEHLEWFRQPQPLMPMILRNRPLTLRTREGYTYTVGKPETMGDLVRRAADELSTLPPDEQEGVRLEGIPIYQ